MSVGTCTPEEQALSISSNFSSSSITCLSRGQTVGLALVAESGCISLLAVLAVLVLIFRRAFRHRSLVQQPMDVYMLSLFAFDLIMALGRVTDIKWISLGKVYTGGYCTAQGVLQQLGETGVALVTSAIAIHTFVVVIWGKLKDNLIVACSVIGCIWVFLIVFIATTVSLNTHGGNYYETPVGSWCWIGDHNRYNGERLAGEWIWMWVALGVSTCTYIPLFFWARGNITVNRVQWWKVDFHRHNDMTGIDPDGRKRRSIGMIAYPLLYCFLVIPISCIRWISGFGFQDRHHIPSAATFAFEFLYSLSGALNVLLFLFTRSELLSIGKTSGKHRLGIAPGINLTASVASTDSQASDKNLGVPMSATRSRSRGDEPTPLGSLPRIGDGDSVVTG